MSEKVQNLYNGDPRVERMVQAIVEKIDEEMPHDTLVVTVLGLLDFVKDHYMQRAYEADEE